MANENQANFALDEAVDFVVVGSGSAGGIIAKELATTGGQVGQGIRAVHGVLEAVGVRRLLANGVADGDGVVAVAVGEGEGDDVVGRVADGGRHAADRVLVADLIVGAGDDGLVVKDIVAGIDVGDLNVVGRVELAHALHQLVP